MEKDLCNFHLEILSSCGELSPYLHLTSKHILKALHKKRHPYKIGADTTEPLVREGRIWEYL